MDQARDADVDRAALELLAQSIPKWVSRLGVFLLLVSVVNLYVLARLMVLLSTLSGLISSSIDIQNAQGNISTQILRLLLRLACE